ncbi:4-(cytidine 5'-diphospho)-2-C-methyl-D-erythritol kinase [Halomonas dongshanensis]|uniref:4-diphosphocytidyl-2-C-methyl-D-erythritol kinase n=1 Tax=Halomonas dongshanensis TaxID=2890835 RepID=A0ABT2EBH0_9GAMM|nr:4-(cytidine 5'-diphospho)-2-C-methyl-D-erythritol kinase [Halomonas dongshanensis]MCS2608926.1 4-(cytidine 5'-diphospho)-2-C-methyl-D-erythritol kinase [Halomonas dongshanensis]
MPASLTLAAPAKLNRMLHVVGRRADGYHELQTLFQLIDLADTLTLTRRDDGVIELLTPVAGVAHADNLVVRAAKRLQAHTGCRYGASIALDKKLPMGGGLGGGSSNAATVLVGLNALWSLDLPLTTLAELGLALGADVPVFVHGRSAWAEGVGERLTPVTLDTPWFVVVHPGVSVSTPAIFQAPELTRDTRPISMARALQGGAPTWRNDCEASVRDRHPPIAEALDWLAQHAPSQLTGTGACVFAVFDTQADAHAVADMARVKWPSWVTRGINTSPLHAALGC